ncbi:hypothetical protein Pint_36427 [Pistacia integerrima]|uniref:Uncharacterized protein n=1 Tax=Pistacia integerrima TaxID=434235 RepID=A0ACC0Y278_9ROSI|nr:hypothetical protein Pint_36427 [Pistacia integerrima]
MWEWDTTRLWKKVREFVQKNDYSSQDPLTWSRELEKHCYGDLSYAQVQASNDMEDQSQVEIRRDATFVGVYDGHGGPEASRFICDNLFLHLMRLARENGAFSEDNLRLAFSTTEDAFLNLVRRTCRINPRIVGTGSCCLVGVIWRGTLYVANVGDSRALIVSLDRSNKIVAEQLTRDHNASIEEVRQELKSLHPDDSHIVVMKHGVWRIKGIIQLARTIGDVYLKRPEFFGAFPKFSSISLCRPVLTAEPSTYARVLQPNDKFLIFASDGLWEHLTNQEAAEIVHNNPRYGVARRLLKTALHIAARKRDMPYKHLKPIEKGIRRHFHDDITVVVIFIDYHLLGNGISVPELSIRGGFIDIIGPSNSYIPQVRGPLSEISNPVT